MIKPSLNSIVYSVNRKKNSITTGNPDIVQSALKNYAFEKFKEEAAFILLVYNRLPDTFRRLSPYSLEDYDKVDVVSKSKIYSILKNDPYIQDFLNRVPPPVVAPPVVPAPQGAAAQGVAPPYIPPHQIQQQQIQQQQIQQQQIQQQIQIQQQQQIPQQQMPQQQSQAALPDYYQQHPPPPGALSPQQLQQQRQQNPRYQPKKKGKGIITIPEKKEELLSRLSILIAAKHAGHSDVEDEKHAILQRLLEKGFISQKDYKKFSKVKLSRKK